ncbi:MAG: DUF2177 family protein [Candidatus Eisenbacteria bacterium]|jgi:uncharacterized membrane protein|nr:DUF2177 family protein [Candidatus Eisenbacteria bacterium]
MALSRGVLLYLLTLPVFFAVDLVWLGVAAPRLYRRHLGHLMADQVNWAAAVAFYLLFIAGIVVLAVIPAIEKGSMGKAVVQGALLGLVAYGTYDLTNLATLRDWPLLITVVDLIWGTILAAVVSAASYLIAVKLG